MHRIKPNGWFLIIWLGIWLLIGNREMFTSPPSGMHQGAQADRACVAWNYYSQSMNFLKPRVSENRQNEGVAGMEFPIVNYMAARSYKAFGYHDALYRVIVFAIVSLGAFFAFIISGFFIVQLTHRLLIVFGWYLSPILVFYSPNFLPDPVAMAFSMAAWYYFIRIYYALNVQHSLWMYTLFTALSGLIKVTFLISHISIAALFVLYKLRPNLLPQGFPKIKFAVLWYFLPLFPVVAWIMYSGYLTKSTGNIHFLQQINPADNFSGLIENFRYGFNTWQESIYGSHILYIIGILYLIVRLKKQNEYFLTSWISAFILIGFLSIFILFSNQFRYHDYYYILLYPSLFFILIYLHQSVIGQQSMFIGLLPIAALIGLFIFPFFNFSHTKKMIKERYTEGSYYHQEAFAGVKQYKNIALVLDKVIPPGEEVVSAFDPTPNTSLYLMKRRGVRIAGDFNPDLAAEIIQKSKAKYLIVNDIVLWKNGYYQKVKNDSIPLYESGIVSVYKLK